MSETTPLFNQLAPSQPLAIPYNHTPQLSLRHTFFHLTSTKVRYIETFLDILFAISLTKFILYLLSLQSSVFELVFLLYTTNGSILQYFPTLQSPQQPDTKSFVFTSLSQLHDIFTSTSLSSSDDIVITAQNVPKSILHQISSSITSPSSLPPTASTTSYFYAVTPIILQMSLFWFIHTQFAKFSNRHGHFKSWDFLLMTFSLAFFYLYTYTSLTDESHFYTIMSAPLHFLHQNLPISQKSHQNLLSFWTTDDNIQSLFSKPATMIQLYCHTIFFNLHTTLPILFILIISTIVHIFHAYRSTLPSSPTPHTRPNVPNSLFLKHPQNQAQLNPILGEYLATSSSDRSSTLSDPNNPLLNHHHRTSSFHNQHRFHPYPLTPQYYKTVSILTSLFSIIAILPYVICSIFIVIKHYVVSQEIFHSTSPTTHPVSLPIFSLSILFLLLIDFTTPIFTQRVIKGLKYSIPQITRYFFAQISTHYSNSFPSNTPPYFIFFRDPITCLNQYLYSQRQTVTIISFIICYATMTTSSLLSKLQPHLHLLSTRNDVEMSSLSTPSSLFHAVLNSLNNLDIIIPPIIVFHLLTFTILFLFLFLYITKSTRVSKLLSPLPTTPTNPSAVSTQKSANNRQYGAVNDGNEDNLDFQQQHRPQPSYQHLFPTFISAAPQGQGNPFSTNTSNNISLNPIDIFFENDELRTFDPLSIHGINNVNIRHHLPQQNNHSSNNATTNNNSSTNSLNNVNNITNSSFNNYNQPFDQFRNKTSSEVGIDSLSDDISNYFLDDVEEDADLLFLQNRQFLRNHHSNRPNLPHMLDDHHHHHPNSSGQQSQHSIQLNDDLQLQQYPPLYQQPLSPYQSHQPDSPTDSTAEFHLPHSTIFSLFSQSIVQFTSFLFIILTALTYCAISDFITNYLILYSNTFQIIQPIAAALCLSFTSTLPFSTPFSLHLSQSSFFTPLTLFMSTNALFVVAALIRVLFQPSTLPLPTSMHFPQPSRTKTGCLSPIQLLFKFTTSLHSVSARKRIHSDIDLQNEADILSSESSSLSNTSPQLFQNYYPSNGSQDSHYFTNFDAMGLKFRQLLKVAFTIDSFYNVEIINADNAQQNDYFNILGPPQSNNQNQNDFFTAPNIYPSNLPTPGQLERLNRRHLTIAMCLHYLLLVILLLPFGLCLLFSTLSPASLLPQFTQKLTPTSAELSYSQLPITFLHGIAGILLYSYFLFYPLLIVALVVAIDRFYKHCYRYYHRLLLLLLYDDSSMDSSEKSKGTNSPPNGIQNAHIHHVHAADKPRSSQHPIHQSPSHVPGRDEYSRIMLAETDDYYSSPYGGQAGTNAMNYGHSASSHAHHQPPSHQQAQRPKQPSNALNADIQPHFTTNPITQPSPRVSIPQHLHQHHNQQHTPSSRRFPSNNKSKTDEGINYSPSQSHSRQFQ